MMEIIVKIIANEAHILSRIEIELYANFNYDISNQHTNQFTEKFLDRVIERVELTNKK